MIGHVIKFDGLRFKNQVKTETETETEIKKLFFFGFVIDKNDDSYTFIPDKNFNKISLNEENELCNLSKFNCIVLTLKEELDAFNEFFTEFADTPEHLKRAK